MTLFGAILIVVVLIIILIIIIKITTRNPGNYSTSGGLMERARGRSKSLLDCCIKKLRGGA
jgi:hypothetical protein